MPVTIRLRRVGRNKQSNYRVVVTEKTAPRDGAYLEAIGFYNPRPKPAELRLDLARLDEWIERGAELSDTVASLARKARRGGDKKVAYNAQPQGKAKASAAAAVTETAPSEAAPSEAAPSEAAGTSGGGEPEAPSELPSEA
jgi:small subunit ribosomal protein S16